MAKLGCLGAACVVDSSDDKRARNTISRCNCVSDASVQLAAVFFRKLDHVADDEAVADGEADISASGKVGIVA